MLGNWLDPDPLDGVLGIWRPVDLNQRARPKPVVIELFEDFASMDQAVSDALLGVAAKLEVPGVSVRDLSARGSRVEVRLAVE